MRDVLPGEPNVRSAVPLYGVRDIRKSLRFYVDGLGYAKTKEWVPDGHLRWCWIELGNAAVMLQEFRREAKTPFVGNAMWVVSVVDPDGYRLHFQSPTDAAEETVYSSATTTS